MSKHDPIVDVPNPEEVRTALGRIVVSDVFRSSPQLASFLSFVVESVLHGRSERIKGYTIGVEVLRRDTKFDPQLDPIVRVEATRLRRALERYYAGPGLDDTVIIDLPRGSYVPTFRRRGEAVDKEPADRPTRLFAFGGRPAWLVPVLGVSALVIAAAVAGAVWLQRTSAPAVTAKGPAGAEQLQPGNGLPVLFVQPFKVTGTPDAQSISAASLFARLTGAFANFDLVNVHWQFPDANVKQTATGQPTDLQPHVDYRLIGTVDYTGGGEARLRFSLVDTVNDNVIWSKVFEHVAGNGDPAAAENNIARQLSEILVQPFGVLYSDGRNKSLRMHLGDPRYRCLLDTAESFRSFDPAQQAHGRACLEKLTALDPNFAIGFTYLAALDLREYQFRLDEQNTTMPPLERALRAARRGVELNPESSRAYEMLFTVLFARGELAPAFAAGDKAVGLNQYDMRSVAVYGSRLIAKGDIDAGMAVLAKAEPAGRIIPGFEQFYLFLGNYLRGDIGAAAFNAGQLTGDTFQLGLIARAIVAQAKGDHDAARGLLGRLVALNPAWRDDLRGSLQRFFQSDSIVDRLAGDLTAAGIAETR